MEQQVVRMLSTTALMMVVCLLSTATVQADLFQYTDKDGITTIVDDASKIPAKYRTTAQTSRSGGSGGERYTSVSVQRNMVIVPVTFSYRSTTVQGRMLLDTGASVTVLFPGLANRLGIKPEHTERAMARIADGSFVGTLRTRVDYMQVGPKTKQYAEVMVVNHGGPSREFDGLLGMNFLGDYRYHINMLNSTLEWQ